MATNHIIIHVMQFIYEFYYKKTFLHLLHLEHNYAIETVYHDILI